MPQPRSMRRLRVCPGEHVGDAARLALPSCERAGPPGMSWVLAVACAGYAVAAVEGTRHSWKEIVIVSGDTNFGDLDFARMTICAAPGRLRVGLADGVPEFRTCIFGCRCLVSVALPVWVSKWAAVRFYSGGCGNGERHFRGRAWVARCRVWTARSGRGVAAAREGFTVMAGLTARWRRSSRSTSGNDCCVEACVRDGSPAGAGGVWVRDSKNPHGPVLVFDARGWMHFVGLRDSIPRG